MQAHDDDDFYDDDDGGNDDNDGGGGKLSTPNFTRIRTLHPLVTGKLTYAAIAPDLHLWDRHVKVKAGWYSVVEA